jgi:hypothetical protein
MDNPERFAGLYVFDFGDEVAVGYTADEIAILLESEKHQSGKVYRIHRAMPDGTMELQGVARERFQLEDGMLFYRAAEAPARADFETLYRLAGETPPPCRMKLQLASMGAASDAGPHATVIIFPAEYTQDVAAWLERIGFEGGDLVEGGPSQVTGYYGQRPAIIERRQLWAASSVSRPAEEVLATTHLAVQRVPA